MVLAVVSRMDERDNAELHFIVPVVVRGDHVNFNVKALYK